MTRDRDGNEDYVTTVLGLAGLAPGIAGAPPVSGIRRDPRLAVESWTAPWKTVARASRSKRSAREARGSLLFGAAGIDRRNPACADAGRRGEPNPGTAVRGRKATPVCSAASSTASPCTAGSRDRGR